MDKRMEVVMIKRIARYKIYVDRARWYYVLIQFFIIVLIYIETKGFELDWWYYPLLVIIILVSLIVIGFADRRAGMLKEEQRFYSTENPVIRDIVERLKRLETND